MSGIFYRPSFKLASHSLSLSYFLVFNVRPFSFIIPHPLFHLPLSVPPVMRKCTIGLHGNSNWLPRWTTLWPGSKQTKKKKRDTRRSITDKLSFGSDEDINAQTNEKEPLLTIPFTSSQTCSKGTEMEAYKVGHTSHQMCCVCDRGRGGPEVAWVQGHIRHCGSILSVLSSDLHLLSL